MIADSIACFMLGAYITAKGYSQEQVFERKKPGKVIAKTIKQKKQIETNRAKYKNEGDVETRDWGAE